MKKKGSITILALWITMLLAVIITLILGSFRMQMDMAKGKKDYLQSEMKGISVANILLQNHQLNHVENSGIIPLETKIPDFQNLPIEIQIHGEEIRSYYTIEKPLKMSFQLFAKREELPVDLESFEYAEKKIKEIFPKGNGDCIYQWAGEIRVSTKEEYEKFIKKQEEQENEEKTIEDPLEEELWEPPGEVFVPNTWYESPWIFGDLHLQGYLLGTPKIEGNVLLTGVGIFKKKPDHLDIEGVLYSLEKIQGEIPEGLEFLKPHRRVKKISLRSLR
ncbi:MAG: hypothetical protein Q4P28_04735 [Tissierellia bacterium]|nr:hypothetical protein [Tissierellia bacterium]